jgi:tRNA A-37 threonylcarbamoyl transferase component Bud32
MEMDDSMQQPAPDSTPPPEQEELDFEGYELQREMSRGGQAIIFSAIKKSTGRKVAIKFFPGGSYATRKEKVRMDREVRVLAGLDHPNIVSVIDRGQTEDGSTYFVLEYVHGRTLAEFIDEYWEHHAAPRTAEDLKELLHLFVRIADAINAAHLRGIVHRDLKPSNIIIDGYGEPHILDFGVALSAVPLTDDDGEPLPPVTWTGEFLGSVQWASPEQAEGDPTRVDVRTDVYSLGIIFYEMLTGDFPYDVFTTLPTVLKNIMEAQPRPPSVAFAERHSEAADQQTDVANPIDEELDAIVLRALKKDREERYQTAGEFAKTVSAYLAGKSAPLPGRRPAPKHGVLIAAAAAGLALLVGGGVWWALRGQDDAAQRGGPVVVDRVMQFMNLYGYQMEGDQVRFFFDPRDYPRARMADGSLGRVEDVPNIQSVAIAGPFNNWDPTDPAWQMTRELRSRFTLTKSLDDFAGQYQWPFKFVVNGNVWVSAPPAADNKEVVIEDTATYNLLLFNPREQQTEDLIALEGYREQVAGIWPGQEDHLVMDAEGNLHLTLSHVESTARIRSLFDLEGIPLASLQLGQARVTDWEALADMTNLRWFVCNDSSYNQFFFPFLEALREEQLSDAAGQLDRLMQPFDRVPAFSAAYELLQHSVRGMQALVEEPDRVPEAAKPFEGRHYLYVAQPMTWTEARAYAEQVGATLASIRSMEMQDWAIETFGWPTLGRRLWIGGTDELVRGSWGWLSGEPWFYENWSPGNPSWENEQARAAAMQYDGWWINLDPEAHSLPFLIEWKPQAKEANEAG